MSIDDQSGKGLAVTCRRFRIEGRVQGVFFRDSTRQVARKLALTGYARNQPDGSVEVLACGRLQSLEGLARWLQSGPPQASVASVKSFDVDEDLKYEDFTIG